MNIKYILLCLSVWGCQTLRAQSPAWLDTLAANNTTLQTLKQQAEAESLQSRSDLRWEDPEVEIGHVFASPKGVEASTSVSVTQKFNWAQLTGQTRKAVRAAQAAAQHNYRTERMNILAEGRRLLTRVVYSNRLCQELEQRLQRALEIQELYEGRYADGDISRIEWNKVRLNTSVARTELEGARTERKALWLELERLNGGRPLEVTDTAYSLPALPALVDLEQLIESRHPLLQRADASVSQAQSEVKVARAQAFPALSVGYTGEFAKGIRSNGIKFGVSLPLWGKSRTRVTANRARLTAYELNRDDLRLQLRAQLRRQYAETLDRQTSADNLQRDLDGTDNDLYLRRSLEAGQISLLDYLLELSFYYGARTTWLETERDARLALAELWNLIP